MIRVWILRWLLRADGALDEILKLPDIPERLSARLRVIELRQQLEQDQMFIEWRSAWVRQFRKWRGQA